MGHARALAPDKRAQSVPPRVSVPGPAEPEDSWTVVNHRRASRTPSTVAFKPKGYDKTARGMTNQEKIAAQADVRKYNDSRAHDPDNFAVVVSGLPEGTSGLELLQGLEKVGFLIERSPVVDAGSTVCERCEMATVEQADAVLAVESIECLGSTLTFSEFEPYSPKGAAEKPRTRRGTVSSPNKSDSPRNGHNPFGSNHSRTPRSPFSTFGGSRRGTFGSFMNRALKADASMEG